MLINIFAEFRDFLLQLLIAIPGIYLAVIPHEVMHGYIAMKNGDYTARNLGRLTMNPLKHIDIVGSIILPIALILFRSNIIFAYAKPVPINPAYFRNFRKGIRNTSLAGPGTNLIIAFLTGSLYGLIVLIYSAVTKLPAGLILSQGLNFSFFNQGPFNFFGLISSMFVYAIRISIFLAIFNFLPVPPLDGSKIVASFLPERAMFRYLSIGRIGFFLIFAILISFGRFFWTFLNPVINFLFINLGFWWRIFLR